VPNSAHTQINTLVFIAPNGTWSRQATQGNMRLEIATYLLCTALCSNVTTLAHSLIEYDNGKSKNVIIIWMSKLETLTRYCP